VRGVWGVWGVEAGLGCSTSLESEPDIISLQLVQALTYRDPKPGGSRH
jgi:hypothetical protein